jgi:hypothetical protein
MYKLRNKQGERKMSNKETEGLVKLVHLFNAQQGVDIYNKFVSDYKRKHLGEIILSQDPAVANKWYSRRGEVFARYVSINYLQDKKNE